MITVKYGAWLKPQWEGSIPYVRLPHADWTFLQPQYAVRPIAADPTAVARGLTQFTRRVGGWQKRSGFI